MWLHVAETWLGDDFCHAHLSQLPAVSTLVLLKLLWSAFEPTQQSVL